MKKIFLFFILFITCTDITFAQRTDRSKFVKDSLHNYINRALTIWRIPGAAVYIVKDNKVVMMKAFDIKELG